MLWHASRKQNNNVFKYSSKNKIALWPKRFHSQTSPSKSHMMVPCHESIRKRVTTRPYHTQHETPTKIVSICTNWIHNNTLELCLCMEYACTVSFMHNDNDDKRNIYIVNECKLKWIEIITFFFFALFCFGVFVVVSGSADTNLKRQTSNLINTTWIKIKHKVSPVWCPRQRQRIEEWKKTESKRERENR